MVRLFASEPFQRKRETVADVLSKPHVHQMFHSWNVPPRYMTGDEDVCIQILFKMR